MSSNALPPVDPILPFGPSITHREIECAADAAALGWNMKRGAYVHDFQRSMAQYVGQQYAFAMVNVAAALHLALLVMRLAPGDEVLVPEIADISVAASILHAGGKPVFCDVDPLTLCLDPSSAVARISPRTKGMVPVHLYGQMCDMPPLMDLAQDRQLFVIENATHALGAAYKGRLAGSFGHVSVFGFDDAQTVTAGGGGMLLSSNAELFARAVKLGTQGHSAGNPFIHDAIGFDYAMSNMQAALGVAQLERLEALLVKKRQIYEWYLHYLRDVPGLHLNPEFPERHNSLGMITLAFDDASMLRHEFMQRLYASGVICQPVAYPLSSMPMFTREDNPVAYSDGLRRIILPCGHNRTEEEIAYVAAAVRDLLARRSVPIAHVEPTGWLQYKAEVIACIAAAKTEGLVLPFTHNGEEYALRALTATDAADEKILAFVAGLQQMNPHVFLSDIPVTLDMTRDMLRNYAERRRDYLLFLVVKGDVIYGHMGLDDVAFQKHECVAEAFMMRQDTPRGLPTAASDVMYAWAKERLGIRRVYNHVVGSNTRARLMASAQGFTEINKTPLYKAQTPGGGVYRPMYILGHDKPEEYFVFSAKDL